MNKKLQLEILWLLGTIILASLVLLPIYQNEKGFAFYGYNIGFIIIFVTFVRYIFLLKYSFLERQKWPKGILFFLCIPIFFLLLEGLFTFQTFLDEHGMTEIYSHLSFQEQKNLAIYTRNEMVFFGVSSLMVTVILPIRLLISYWRDVNIK